MKNYITLWDFIVFCSNLKENAVMIIYFFKIRIHFLFIIHFFELFFFTHKTLGIFENLKKKKTKEKKKKKKKYGKNIC